MKKFQSASFVMVVVVAILVTKAVPSTAATMITAQVAPLDHILQTINTEIITRFTANVSASDAHTAIMATGGTEKQRLATTVLASYASADRAADALKTLNANPNVVYAFYNQRITLPTDQSHATFPDNPMRQERHDGDVIAAAPHSPAESAAEPNLDAVRPFTASNAPLRTYQWHLDRIGENLAPSLPASAPTVAVIDSGMDYTHPDLAANYQPCPPVPGLPCDLIEFDQDPMDTNGHGTHVASTIAAPADGIGITGVSPRSTILPVRVFGNENTSDLMTIFQALDYVMQAKVQLPNLRVVNMSFGANVRAGDIAHQEFLTRLNGLHEAGILPVAAAGNGSDNLLQEIPMLLGVEVVALPAQAPSVLAVAATDYNDYRASFSNYSTAINLNSCTNVLEGPSGLVCSADNTYTTKHLDVAPVAAPGWLILAATPGGQYTRFSGTSMASAIGTGTVARVMSHFETRTNDQIVETIRNTGVPLDNSKGFPITTYRLDLRRALGIGATGFTGRVVDGVNGKPLAGATVTLSTEGRVVDATVTNSDGFYTVTGAAEDASYELRGSKTTSPAYIEDARTATAASEYLVDPGDLSLAPVPTEGSYTILLDWNNVATGYAEWLRSTRTDPRGTRYPWLIDPASLPFTFMDAYFGVPFPGEPDDSMEFSWYNSGALGTFPYGRLIHDALADSNPHEGILIRQLPPLGSLRYGVKFFSPGGAAKTGAAVRLYQNDTLLQRSLLAQAEGPTDGTEARGTRPPDTTWALYDLTSDGALSMPTANVHGMRSETPTWIHRNNDIQGVAGPDAGQSIRSTLTASSFGSCWRASTSDVADRCDVYHVSLAAGESYTFYLMGPDNMDFDLLLFSPLATSVVSSRPVASGATRNPAQESITYSVPSERGGTYYIVVRTFNGAGAYTLARR